MVKERELTDRDPEHALRIALGKKVSSGELLRTRAGRYALPTKDEAPAAAGDGATSAPAPPKKRKHRPGELWKHMKAYMGDYPDGQTLDELVEAAEAGRWTNAESARHAVKICLTRVGAQVERLEGGRFKLAGLQAQTGSISTVRRRRKERDASDVGYVGPAATASGAETKAPPAEEQPFEGTDANGRAFDASNHYPTPRSRLPR